MHKNTLQCEHFELGFDCTFFMLQTSHLPLFGTTVGQCTPWFPKCTSFNVEKPVLRLLNGPGLGRESLDNLFLLLSFMSFIDINPCAMNRLKSFTDVFSIMSPWITYAFTNVISKIPQNSLCHHFGDFLSTQYSALNLSAVSTPPM